MQTKKYLYAAVGVQVAAAKAAQAKLEELMDKVGENATSATSDLKDRVDVWAGEGEKFLGRVTDTKAIDELTSKVDFDQVQTQVNKLRDQLEDIVSTWRSNFRPEVEKVKVEATVTAETTEAPKSTSTAAAKKPAAKKPAAKTTATKTTAAKKPAAKKPAAKSTATKSTAAKKPAAKKPAAKSTATQKAS
ncbi:MAG: hypothetical protein R3246_01325 [Acidimicrobiia bacterium]|nr:hypothetical protein [Acidimicrobiia bacterium]